MTLKKQLHLFKEDFSSILQLLWLSGKKTAIINITIQFLLSLLPIATLYCIKLLIEYLVKPEIAFDKIAEIIILFGISQLLFSIVNQYNTYITGLYQQKLTDHLSLQVLDKAIAVDYEYYENPDYHDNLHLAQQQSVYKASQLLSNFNALLLNSLSLLFLLSFFISLNSLFGLLFLLLSVPLACIKWYSGYATLRMEQKFAPLEREANYLHQVVTGLNFAKEVRLFDFGTSFIKKFRAIRSHIYNSKKGLQSKLMIYSLFAEAAEIIVMALIFGFLAKSVWEKTITLSVFVIYLQGFQRLQTTSRGFLQAIVQVFQQRLFLKDLFSFLNLPAKNLSGSSSFPMVEVGLSIKNLSFKYPQTEKLVLKDVSINCKPGQIIAIVGENGSGKTTLVKLLAKLYTLQTGAIFIDEVSVNEIEEKEYRLKTAFLFQDFERYFFSVQDNITFDKNGGDEDTNARVKKAAISSGADTFIQHLTNGYDTRLGRTFQNSEQLSGGQWQKLALARVFYKDAELVVLDEPTSAIDPEAEFELFKHIKEIALNKMVILVSHRLYNLKMASHIYVMHEGNVAEEGSFDQLIENDGLFKKLYDLQKL
ncbi:ABC transporter ATP-binding protein [Pedobacter changchengzhani]|uniref:ABC transporter ATP-binding protein n=1 Tax=Pedobacter changchengzhani TaxID=2529274 RepID=UPI001FB68351|nr:ABC transporter ATP-binding protein [Pedobacter changchengzhani]